MKNRLIVLNYHQVPEQPDELRAASICRHIFRGQLSVLRQYFNVLRLEDAFKRMLEGTLPPRAVVITFDDGYRDNFDVALPELQQAKLPATFFIATDYLDGGCMWNDKIAESIRLTKLQSLDLGEFNLGMIPLGSIHQKRVALQQIIQSFKYMSDDVRTAAVAKLVSISQVILPNDLMMSSKQVLSLHQAGMTIGGHTASHPILKNLSLEQAQLDIEKGRSFLSDLIDQPIEFFAYPNGKPNQDYDHSHTGVLSDIGFTAAFSTQWGYVDHAAPKFELPRVGFSQTTGWKFALKACKSYFEKAQA